MSYIEILCPSYFVSNISSIGSTNLNHAVSPWDKLIACDSLHLDGIGVSRVIGVSRDIEVPRAWDASTPVSFQYYNPSYVQTILCSTVNLFLIMQFVNEFAIILLEQCLKEPKYAIQMQV